MRQFLIHIIIASTLFFSASIHAEQPTNAPKKWTILIFANDEGNGPEMSKDMEEYANFQIKQMETIGSSNDVNIVIQQFHFKKKYATRVKIEKSTNPKTITSPIIQDLGYVDMTDYRLFQDFIDWGVANYPADHYLIMIKSHGSGWETSAYQPPPSTKRLPSMQPISIRNKDSKTITTPQLGEVMRHTAKLIGHKVDIFGTDACLMQDIEDATELSESVQYIIGSEDVTRTGGGDWEYEHFLTKLVNEPGALPLQVGKMLIVSVYEKTQSPEQKKSAPLPITFSVIDASKIPELNRALALLAANIRSVNNPDDLNKITNTMASTLTFDRGYQSDLLDFIKKLLIADINSLDKNNLRNIEQLINDAVVYKFNQTDAYLVAGGISMWIPSNPSGVKCFSIYMFPDSLRNTYHALKFDRDTTWGQTIAYLYFDNYACLSWSRKLD